MRVVDGEPGGGGAGDFGHLGYPTDPTDGRRRKVHDLPFTAVLSRHLFVWLTYSQTLLAVIAGCEAAWVSFGGVFKVPISDNMKAIVVDPDPVNPRLSTGWLDYAQHAGFGTHPARVRSPKDYPEDLVIPSRGRCCLPVGWRAADPRDNYLRPASWRIKSSSPFQRGASSGVVLAAFWIASRTIWLSAVA